MTYTDFKNICTSKVMWESVQYDSFIIQNLMCYKLRAYDGPEKYECDLENPDEVVDFETNYKAISNKPIVLKSVYGSPIYSTTFEDVQGLYPKKKMYKNIVVASQLNFFDIVLEVEKRICGGEYWIVNADSSKVHEDDYIEFSVVDKDNVLGLFALYGLQVGVDILELCKFVINDYVKKGNDDSGYHTQLYEVVKGTTKVIPGLYYRVSYDSHGTENIGFMWRIYYYE